MYCVVGLFYRFQYYEVFYDTDSLTVVKEATPNIHKHTSFHVFVLKNAIASSKNIWILFKLINVLVFFEIGSCSVVQGGLELPV